MIRCFRQLLSQSTHSSGEVGEASVGASRRVGLARWGIHNENPAPLCQKLSSPSHATKVARTHRATSRFRRDRRSGSATMFVTVREAAALLACTERQIYRWVDEAEIPFQRVRDQVRFNRTDLLEWATARRLPISLEVLDANLDPDDRTPSLAKALRIGGVHHDVPAIDRDSALREVVERTPIPDTLDREFLVEVLIARENTVSTAIGDGIAIPHVRQPVVAPGAPATVSVSYLRSPVWCGRWQACPGDFLIVSPSVRRLQMLAHVARSILDPGFRAALDRHGSTEELAVAASGLENAVARSVAPDRPTRGGAD
jgi:PTS system nitrogen regulatory IIA component